MTAKEQLDFQAARQELNVKREKFDRELRDLGGFDTPECDVKCKTVYVAEQLKWKESVFDACKANSRSIECRQNEEL
jgi:hypothetical protein